MSSPNRCIVKLGPIGELMKRLSYIFLFLFINQAEALIYEIGLDFSYDKQIYGNNRLNSQTSRTYSGGVSTYLFETTALDLNYSSSKDITTQNEVYDAGGGFDLVGQQNRVETNVYGIGVKQMLLPRKYRLMPLVSVGYARQFITYETDLTLENRATDIRTSGSSGESKARVDSMFGAFILQYKMTDRLSIKGSVKTIFPSADWNKARDNIKYAFGISWIF